MQLLAAQSQSIMDLGIHVILGGFGLFMLGINSLGDGFKKVAGNRMRDYIDKYTSNLFSAILVGALITGIMQSSSAATVISISLVRAGLMRLDQAIGISLGANIGTTVTAIIVGLNIDEMGYFFLFIGAMMVLFASRRDIKNYGQVVLAFGLTFVGLQIMSEKLMLIQQMPFFEALMVQLSDHPWFAMLGGTVLTGIINSSSATIAVVQKIYGNGGMSMVAATAFVFGSNIGTTVTALFASMGGSIATRRAGLFHTMFNVIGAVLMMLFVTPYSQFILKINALMGGTDAMAVGIAHFVFNLFFAILVIPFVPAFIRLLKILIPGEDKIRSREKLKPLDRDIIHTYPEGALQLAKARTTKMGDLVLEAVDASHGYLHSKDDEDYEIVMQLEGMVNQLDTELTEYLLEIMKHSNSDSHIADTYTKYLEVIKNYERMSDLSTNLVEFYRMVFENRENFSEDALHDLDTMYKLLMDMMRRSLKIFDTEDLTRFDALIRDEEYLDLIEDKYREKHFQRMAEGICDEKVASSIFIDVLGILERIGDHGVNVSGYVHSAVGVHANREDVILKSNN
ncbi:Na/Pi cotransporter family protein [Erysipelothrix piscisicarius]|uniref:Na/Pi cotransporter family protein n=1 Tax=Erysipelothrix piscisicarius TaxID=2485784 RepID=A0A3S8RMF5_9FIRM|nr:Na/Pi cotransporter family protein [Erysipelothrix piscisicarius]AZK44106.1 Na/Pi cotransporter family protein [Erysipelothrix piscisicarius]